jgi:hypothetical protein
MEINTIAVDLAKRVFQVHGFSGAGERVLVKRVGRGGFERLMRELAGGGGSMTISVVPSR